MARRHQRSNIVGVLLAGTLVMLSGCQTARAPEEPAIPAISVLEEPGWRRAALAGDIGRIDRIDGAWDEALSAAAAAGHRRTMISEGPLLDPGAALPMPAPTPGAYTCRLLRFAESRRRGPVLTVYRPFFCNVGVDGDALTVIKQTGSERPAGHLWVDDRPERLIFIGSLSRGESEDPLPYGEDPDRDMVAVLERVDAFRFRLVVPWPRTGAILEVYELTPSPVQYQE